MSDKIICFDSASRKLKEKSKNVPPIVVGNINIDLCITPENTASLKSSFSIDSELPDELKNTYINLLKVHSADIVDAIFELYDSQE